MGPENEGGEWSESGRARGAKMKGGGVGRGFGGGGTLRLLPTAAAYLSCDRPNTGALLALQGGGGESGSSQ